MTDTNEKLTAAVVLRGVREMLTKDGKELTNEDLLTICQPFFELTDYADEDAFRTELEKVLEEEALTADCIQTLNRDLQQFCSVGYAPVKMAYMEQFNRVWGNLLLLDQAQDQWCAAYRRLVKTEWGAAVVTQTRFTVCNWFAKQGNPEAGDFDQRLAQMFSEWDAWELQAGGVFGKGERLTCDEVKDTLPSTYGYQERLGLVTAMVFATDSYLAEHAGDEAALAQWPIVQEYYDGDVAYVSKEFKYLTSDECKPPYFDAMLETLIPLIFHSGRFQNVDGMWVVSRIEELLNLELPTEEAVVKN